VKGNCAMIGKNTEVQEIDIGLKNEKKKKKKETKRKIIGTATSKRTVFSTREQ